MADALRRILLVRLDGLGDALVCVPALEGLRRAFPDARFGAICSQANAALFSRSRVRDVYVHPGGGTETEFLAALRAASYTDAMVATEEPAGYLLARASGARRRSGFWHRFEKTFKSVWQYAQLTERVYRPAAWVDDPEHEVGALYRLAERLGARAPIPTEAAALRDWLDVDAGDEPVVGADAFAFQISPKLCSGGWTPSALAAMANGALDASPFRRCVILASPSDQGLAAAVLEQFPRAARESNAAALAPQSGLSKWLGAVATAGALLTPDTGAAHAAGMLGVPVVDLFEEARFEQLSRQWRPWAADSRCIVKPANGPDSPARLASTVGVALTELARARGVAS
jgi:ADP-heptose:LPS heptosyltransferase